MLKTHEETIALAKKLEAAGISALAIHCRTRDDRPHHPAKWDVLKLLAAELSIPLIANGDITGLQAMETLRTEYNVSSFMLARAAQMNVSVFGADPPLPTFEMGRIYLKKVSAECGISHYDCSS